MDPLAIYIHWPFCQSKCPYCDFNSHVAPSIDHSAWREAYARELKHYAENLPGRRITSIFFGGGTPSLMDVGTVENILKQIQKSWTLDDTIEITLEANPGSVEADKFAQLRAAGINRLSLGIQALDNDALKFLGRTHSADEGRRAIQLAGEHFTRFSFDLIYARQGQNQKAWEKELQEALQLAGSHLSLYQLTIEPSTLFHTRTNQGEALTAPEGAAATMFEATRDILANAGLPAYEISNHAKAGEESRHNLTYWHYEDYIGIGPGAHGRYRHNGERLATDTHRSPDVWLKHVSEKGIGLKSSEPIDQETAMREALMMGLRLAAGIKHESWDKKFATPLTTFLSPEKLARLASENYLRNDNEKLGATPEGLLRLNAVLNYLLN